MKTKFLHYAFLGFMLAVFTTANAATNNWIGGVGARWDRITSWSLNTIPATGDDVVISNTTSNATIAITNMAAATVNSLTIKGNNTVTLTGTAILTIGAGGLNIEAGSTLKMSLNCKVAAGTSFNASGLGSLWTAATTAFLPTNTTCPFDVTFNTGSSPTIPSDITFNKGLTINLTNATDKVNLASATTVNGQLTLTTGLIDCLAYTLTLSSTASVSGGSSTSYIYSSSGATGYLIRNCAQSTSTLFPIGVTPSGSGIYTPLTITNPSVTSNVILKLNKVMTALTFTNPKPIDATRCIMLEWPLSCDAANNTANITFQFNSTNFGSAPYVVTDGSELAFSNGSTYSRVWTGIVPNSAPYSLTATGLSIPTTGTNTYVIGNKGQVLAATAPPAPTITSVTAGDGLLNVAFTAPSLDGGADITDYKYTVNGTDYVSTGTSSPFTISGLLNNTIYSVQLKAHNSAGDGTASNSISGTPAGGTLIAPTITFTSATINKNYGDAAFTQTASSNSSGAKTYTSGTIAVATVDASTGDVTIVGAGSSIITVSQAASGIYDVGTQTYTLNVAAKPLSISGLTVSKPYDGTTTASVAGTAVLPTAEAYGTGSTSDGIPYSGDVVTVSTTASSGTYSSKDAGSRTITYSGLSLGGANAGNYTIGTTAGTITPKALSASPSGGQKNYSGTLPAGTITATLSGLIGSETLVVTAVGAFRDVSAGTGKTIDVTYTLADGTVGGKAANYSLANGTTTNNISKKPLNQAVTSIDSKPYDGTLATGTVTLGALTGFVNGETVTVSVNTSTYPDANVGTGKSATIAYTLANGTNGGLASNYSCGNNTTTTGNITAKNLNIGSPGIASKVYDGSATSGTVTAGTLSGFVSGESVSVTSATGTYSDANVGAGKPATVVYTLADDTGLASNYSATGSANGDITAIASILSGSLGVQALLAGTDITVATNLIVDNPVTVHAITVASGAKLDLSTNTLTLAGDLVLQADKTTAPSVNVTKGISMSEGSKLILQKTMGSGTWYFMSFPSNVTIANITQVSGTGTLSTATLNTNWWIKYYDGAARAVNLGAQSNWVAMTSVGTLNANQGYIIGLDPSLTGDYVLSFPLNKTLVQSAEAARTVSVETYGEGSVTANSVGWNLVGSPYLSKFAGSGVGASYLNFWNGTTYTQSANTVVSSINPFNAFFIQASAAGTSANLSFTLASRQLVKNAVSTNESDNVELKIVSPTGVDKTTLILDNAYTTDYVINQDLEKWVTTGTDFPQLYTRLNNVNYAFNALPVDNVDNLSLGYYSKNGGSTTIGINAAQAPSLSGLLLTDITTGTTTDLMVKDYTFTSDAGTTNNRFVLKAKRVTTDNKISIDGTNQTVLSVVNNMLIINNITAKTNVRVFDAIGRLVSVKTSSASSEEIKLPAKGFYTIQLENNTGTETIKVVNQY